MRKFEITLSQAIEGFILEKRAQQLRPQTLYNYKRALQRLFDCLPDDPFLNDVTSQQIVTFLADLGKKAVAPAGIAPRPAKPLSKKSLLNIHAALSSFWSWATREGYADCHVIRAVPPPRPERRVVVTFSQDDVKRMMVACETSRSYSRPGKRECANARPTVLRDRAILLLLLDSGIRATELCGLRLEHVDMKNRRVKIFGKGSKERIVRVGRRTTKAIWRYLTARPDARPSDPLFVATGEVNQPMTRSSLYRLVRRLGDRAGVVPAAYPHRFRHTFAVNFLRNGGDVFSLQSLLGHSSLEMVHRYVALAQTDTENAHRRASPVDNWRL